MENLLNALAGQVTGLLHLIFNIALFVLALKLLTKFLGFPAKLQANDSCNMRLIHPTTTVKLYSRLDNTGQKKETSKPSQVRECTKGTAVITFNGDVAASGADFLAEMVDEIILNKERFNRAVVVINSPGGGVSQYGRLYAEMERLVQAQLELVSCIDVVAASGGYLMALPSTKIVAAPWATVGSIGVVTEFINFHDILKNLGITPILVTAGKLKRTVTPLSEVKEEALEHLKAQLEAFHSMFKSCLSKYRQVDLDAVATGEFWTASQAVEMDLGLVDELATSHQYLMNLNGSEDLFYFEHKVNPWERRFTRFAIKAVDHAIAKLTEIHFHV
ncbi:MAG: S49 family peptidase [Candidatus Obscuribacter sp.]|nr:S49 family peptidase [Candidatus Obscuribacter sp.]